MSSHFAANENVHNTFRGFQLLGRQTYPATRDWCNLQLVGCALQKLPPYTDTIHSGIKLVGFLARIHRNACNVGTHFQSLICFLADLMKRPNALSFFRLSRYDIS